MLPSVCSTAAIPTCSRRRENLSLVTPFVPAKGGDPRIFSTTPFSMSKLHSPRMNCPTSSGLRSPSPSRSYFWKSPSCFWPAFSAATLRAARSLLAVASPLRVVTLRDEVSSARSAPDILLRSALPASRQAWSAPMSLPCLPTMKSLQAFTASLAATAALPKASAALMTSSSAQSFDLSANSALSLALPCSSSAMSTRGDSSACRRLAASLASALRFSSAAFLSSSSFRR
mmetsp:Transcript_16962/g.45089  ORF Transcript_16962/g.45089 Transcript_16962/m.45089 type:complete len:230 (-) Transcript_16962:112-801(-)